MDLELYNKLSSKLLRETVLENPFIPQTPTPKQGLFLVQTGLEVLFGGAAGPGKSSALLMASLQFVDVPGYAALLLRKSFSDLTQPDALIPRSMSWLGGKALWSSQRHEWEFPSGAILRFGYVDTAADIYQYQGAAFQFIGWDELTQFRKEADYRYLFSRLRKPADMKVPLRMRASSNPGGIGHAWVKRRFLEEGQAHGRLFIPARLQENPHLNREQYLVSLAELDPVTRKQLVDGDWSVRPAGSLFKREWFEIVESAPALDIIWARFWDLAATAADEGGDPDWTSGALLGLKDGVWYLKNISRLRARPKGVEDRIKQTANLDPAGTAIGMEQEGGASGKTVIDHYARTVLPGFNFRGVPSVTSKLARAGPFSSAAESGNFKLVAGYWAGEFLDEVEAFAGEDGGRDDQVDSVTGAMAMIKAGRRLFIA